MAGEKRRLAGELAAWHVATIAEMFGVKGIDPRQLNPYREVWPPTPAELDLARWHRQRRTKAMVDASRPVKKKG